MSIIHLTADILTLQVDALVNPSNPALVGLGSGGLNRQVYEKYPEVFDNPGLGLHTGQATSPQKTLGGPAKYIIHTVGPTYGNPCWDALLRSSYTTSLTQALISGLKTIALPLISTGIYGVPIPTSRLTATEVAQKLSDDFDTIYIVTYPSL